MILIFSLLGLLLAAVVYYLYPPLYQSSAKLLVRYVLDRSAVDSLDSPTGPTTVKQMSESVLNSEVEILTSRDLAVQVAEAIGPNRLLHSKTAVSKEAAAGVISAGLKVTAATGSSIIYVDYQSSDPELVPLVLDELLNRYFIKHLEVHRSAGAFEFVSQQTAQERARLTQTEKELKDLKAKVGIASLADGTLVLSGELTRAEEQLHLAQADLAEQRARVKEMHLPLPGADTDSSRKDSILAGTGVAASKKLESSDQTFQEYQITVNRIADLRKSELELSSKFAPGNVMVQVARTQIADLLNQKRVLERKYPDLSERLGHTGSPGQPGDTLTESARLAGTEARTEALRIRVDELMGRMKQLAELAPDIGDLERKRELEENNYKYFQNTLEKARVDEALDPTKIPNISAVQRPSPPVAVTGKRNKTALAFAGMGLVLGIALALLRELVLSQTIKRPSEIEAQLQTSLLLAIPDASFNGYLVSPENTGGPSSDLVVRSQRGSIAPWDAGHFIRSYCEAIRDRIGLYFDLHNLTHKPKLVGVTSFSKGAGTSTLAAGLAAALSETDDGKVLLVDVNLGPEHVHPFFKGKPAYPLMTALKPPSPIDAASENLYLATVGNSPAGVARLGLKKFFDLMPNLKASDFDYIIFDMPPLASTSPTWGMAGFMDKLLLVVEADKSNREIVKRGYGKLMAERSNVSVVLNKTRSYLPKALDNES